MTKEMKNTFKLSFKKFFFLNYISGIAFIFIFLTAMMLSLENRPTGYMMIFNYAVFLIAFSIFSFLGTIMISNFISYKVDKRGITLILLFQEKQKKWEEIKKVRGTFLTYGLSSGFWDFQGLMLFKPWLLAEKKGFLEAIDEYAPKDHIIRKIIKS